MNEDKELNAPERCLHCKSHNLIGPYKYGGAFVAFTFFKYVKQNAYVCVDCGYTMLFTRRGDESKVMKEAIRQQ